MENKKKFLIAIILFIFLGLTIFTFANPADKQIKEQGTGNGDGDAKFEEPKPKEEVGDNNANTNVNETLQAVVNGHGVRTDLITIVDNQGTNNNGTNDEEDDTYAKALAAVILAESKLESVSYESALELVNSVTNNEQQTELNDRLTEVKNAIDVKELVATLYDKTNKASNKVEMDDARDFRTLEEVVDKVSSLSNATLKDELESTLEELSKLLDDNTPAGRVYSTIRESETMKVYDDGKNKNYYIKNGDSFVFAISYDEELKSNPIAVIGGREVELILNEKVKEEENKYLYEGKFEIGENELELAEGLLEITIKNVIDMAFNESTDETAVNQTRTSNGRSVIYDITAPKFNFSNGKIASKFTVEVEDDNFDYMTVTNMKTGKTETINTSVYELPNEGADNLRYDIIAYDRAGNQTKKVNIYIDNTNPVFDGNGIVGSKEQKLVNNGVYKKATLNVKDGSLKKVVKVNGTEEETLAELADNYNTNKVMSYEKTFEEEGTYTIKTIDRLGNESVITFIVDKTKPVISNVENGKYYNTDVTPVVTDENLKNVTVKLNGKDIKNEYKLGDTLTKEGTYTIVATDKAMNKTVPITFTIDKTLNNPSVVEILGLGAYNGNTEYVKNGKTVRVFLTFDEELISERNSTFGTHNGILTINGEQSPLRYNPSDSDVENKKFNYIASYTIPEDAKIADGELAFEVTVFGDHLRNTIDPITSTINARKGRTKVIYDNTKPVFNVEDGLVTNQNVLIDIIEDNYEYATIKNGTSTNQKNKRFTIEREGTSTITAYDKAGNEATINITIDKTAPEHVSVNLLPSGNEPVPPVTNGARLDFYVFFDEQLGTVPTLKLSNGKEITMSSEYKISTGYKYYGSYVLTDGDGIADGELSYEIYGYADKVGNVGEKINNENAKHSLKSQSKIVIDRTKPEVDKVQVYNITNSGSTYVKNGDMIRVLATFKDELSNLPVLKVSDETVKFTKIAGGNGEVIYSAYLTIPEDESKLTEGTLEFTISEYKDIAGNVGNDVTNTSARPNLTYDRTVPKITVMKGSVGSEVYSKLNIQIFDANTVAKVVINGKELPHTGKYVDINDGHAYTFVDGENIVEATDKAGNVTKKTFVVDKTAPSYNFVEIKNIDQKTEGYAKVGDRVWVYVVANEHLSQEPTITINGVKAKIVQTEDGANFDADWYKYVGEVVMTEEMAEGEIKFTINEYKDLAGNQGLELTNANINKGLKSITLDKTAPKITVKDNSVVLDEVYGKLNIQIFDTNTVADVVINGKKLSHNGKYVDINDGHAYTFVDGINTIEATDKAGNVTTKTFVVDKTAPSYKSMGILPASSTGTAYAKAGTKLTVNIQFTEELGVKPQLKVNGKEIDNAFNNGTQRGEVYIYTAYYTIIEEDSEGEIQLEVSGYADKFGNVGKTLTNENLNIGGQKKVVIDKTAPVISIDRKVELSVGDEFIEDIYSKISDNYTNASDLKVEIYPVNGIAVDTNTAGTYQINYKISDKNGNYSVTTRTVIVKE